MSPKVTIFLPTYNRRGYLEKSLGSALAQTYRNIEILVLNNGSTDGTKELLAQYKDEKIRVLESEQNVYPHDLDWILSAATGEYYICLSDDDWLEPAFVERVLALWLRHPELAFVHARCASETEGQSVLRGSFPEIQDGADLVFSLFQHGRGPSLCATLFRTADVRRRLDSLRGDYLGDAPLWTSIALGGKVGFVDELLSHYRIHQSSTFVSSPVHLMLRDYNRTAVACLQLAQKLGLSSAYRYRLERAWHRAGGGMVSSLLLSNAAMGRSKLVLLSNLYACRREIHGGSIKAFLRLVCALTWPGGMIRAWIKWRSAAKTSA